MSDSAARPPAARSVYRVRRAYFARALGRAAIAAAAALVLTSLGLWLSAPGALVTIGVVVTTVLLVVTALAAISVALPPMLLQLDTVGYRSSRRHTAGPHQADWVDVAGASSQHGPQGWVLFIHHRDGRQSAVPLSVADAAVVEVEHDVRRRLDDAHGYRPLP